MAESGTAVVEGAKQRDVTIGRAGAFRSRDFRLYQTARLLGILGALIAIPVAAAALLILDQVVVPRQAAR